MKQPRLCWPLLSLFAFLCGCTALDGTDYVKQSRISLDSMESWQQQQSDAVATVWLTDLVQADALQQLVQHGLARNPGVRQTALAIAIARENVNSVKADRLPQAGLTLSHSDAEQGDTAYQADLQVSWAVDWLQKLTDSVDSSETALAGRIAADQYARDLLASSIMDTWLQLIQQRQLIDIEQSRLKVLEQNEKTIVERYRKGLDELTDLDSARSQSASARATLAALLESAEVLQRSLSVLLGETDYRIPVESDFPRVILPLTSIPPQDLGRRPDLRQAYLQVKAADLDSAVAYKALLPSLSLSWSLTQKHTSFRDSLFTSPAWSLLNQLTAPLFQGGRLRAQARSADLTAQQRYWAYQEQLLAAVKEVEDALGQEASLTQQQQHVEEALANAERSFTTYQTKYRQGLVTFLDLLTIQTQTFDLQARKTQLVYQRLSNRIGLGLALGLGVKS